MNIVNGSKSFYRFMKRDGVVLAYFYVDDFGIIALKNLKNVFAENNNGNITVLMVDFKKSNQKLIDTEDITDYPIIRLYKQGNLFQEIYATFKY